RRYRGGRDVRRRNLPRSEAACGTHGEGQRKACPVSVSARARLEDEAVDAGTNAPAARGEATRLRPRAGERVLPHGLCPRGAQGDSRPRDALRAVRDLRSDVAGTAAGVPRTDALRARGQPLRSPPE